MSTARASDERVGSLRILMTILEDRIQIHTHIKDIEFNNNTKVKDTYNDEDNIELDMIALLPSTCPKIPIIHRNVKDNLTENRYVYTLSTKYTQKLSYEILITLSC